MAQENANVLHAGLHFRFPPGDPNVPGFVLAEVIAATGVDLASLQQIVLPGADPVLRFDLVTPIADEEMLVSTAGGWSVENATPSSVFWRRAAGDTTKRRFDLFIGIRTDCAYSIQFWRIPPSGPPVQFTP